MSFSSCDTSTRETPSKEEEAHPHTVIALYTEACSIVKRYAGRSESFDVKVGLHQRSVLSPLLFAVIMDVVSSDCFFETSTFLYN